MKKRILLFLKYFLFWYLFFVVCKILFLVYHFRLTKELSITDIGKVLLYGSKMDLSMTGYFTVLPGLVFVLTSYFKGKIIARIINIYTIILLLITGFLVIADMELYRFWGFRMDTTPLMYLKNPKEAAGSANVLRSLLLIGFWILFYIFSVKIYLRFIGRKLKELSPANWVVSLAFLPLTASLILPIRGSLDVAPMNIGFVYFHKANVFANHAAINVIWNIAYALNNYNDLKPYHYFERQEAEKIFARNYKDNGKPKYLLNTDKPNVIILIVESFTNKIIEPLGGMKGITPDFNALSHEGILFSNCYATGDRTDKGIISVLNGYPGHPKTAIINFPKKTEKLPFLNLDLKKTGYYNEFVYGYDIDYANFRSYFLNAKYDKVISKANFDPSLCNSKWGVHDHYVLNRLLDECNAVPHQPFFMAFASQSSHEPFQVPMKTVIPGNDDEHLYLNSAYYADSSLGDFIRKAKKTSWWKNTLIVMVADHGISHPGNTTYNFPKKYNIPMLWLGGALAKKDTIISTYFSQSDFPLTLLHQLKLDNRNYKFSQDFLSNTAPAFGFYVSNEGIALLQKGGRVIYDHAAGRAILQEGNNTDSLIIKAKAQLQVLSTDFSER
jgi:phosphoglycerol transferase MdoB-like AlkP superfamily enzyme